MDHRPNGWRNKVFYEKRERSGRTQPNRRQSQETIVLAAWAIAMSMAGAAALATIPAQASSDSYKEGVRLYGAKQYRKALLKFFETKKEFPEDGFVCYYMGNCYMALSDRASAKQCYADAIKYGKSQPPAINGLKALIAMGELEYAKTVVPPWNYKLQCMLPGGGTMGAEEAVRSGMQTASAVQAHQSKVTNYAKREQTSSTSSTSSIDTSLPSEGSFDIVNIPQIPNVTFVSGAINGRPVKAMRFDTGAEMCLFGKNHLADYGIQPPSGPATSEVRGVGGSQDAWRMNVDLKVGNIERRNFTITVQNVMNSPPLLGQTFFKDYQCQVDKRAGKIRLVRSDVYSRSASAASHFQSQQSVPFTKEGNLLVVEVEVNGRRTKMVLDTGADETQFTKEQLQAASVVIPQNAQQSESRGVGGATTALVFPVSRMRMGPIAKDNYPIRVLGTAHMPYPLLGQSFFGDWRYSIDNVNNQIKFHGH
jgi:predicted aspartyl protease